MEPAPEKYKELVNRLQLRLESIAIGRCFSLAFSGGLDSRFLVLFAKKAGMNPSLLHICGPHMPPFETNNAIDWARDNGFDIRIIPLSLLDEPLLAKNPKDRCYACKKRMVNFLKMQSILPLVDGSNKSDGEEYRPGLRAIKEMGVHSPLLEAGFTKEDIRAVGKLIGLSNTGQRPSPCLFTRIPYGFHVTENILARLGNAEEQIHELFKSIFPHEVEFRVRILTCDTVELHLKDTDYKKLQQEHRLQAVGILKGCFSEFNFHRVRLFESISGFFDKHPEFSIIHYEGPPQGACFSLKDTITDGHVVRN